MNSLRNPLKYSIIVFILAGTVSSLAGAEASNHDLGFTDTPFLPSGWRVHDPDRPQPVVVAPGKTTCAAPSDAIILFDGSNLDQWVGTKQDDPQEKRYNPEGIALWKVEDDYMECTPSGDLISRQAFGDCQLHVEWQVQDPPVGNSQGRGNSGVFLMGKYEIQVLDCYQNATYADGSTGSVYGQTPPLVNACRKPGEWQSYDIIFQAPRFQGKKLKSPAYFTVFLNGVLVQHHTKVLGPTTWRNTTPYSLHPDKLPLVLQDHNNKTRFRNIWIRELDLVD